MYLSPDKIIYFDLETDSLEPTKIWCGVFKEKHTQQVWKFDCTHGFPELYHELRRFVDDRVRERFRFVAHNGISFDNRVLARFCGTHVPLSLLVDTLVLSYLYNPALEGGHSLEAYGVRLKYPKIEHNDWTQYSPAMLHRCEQDVELLERVHDGLLTRMKKIGFSELSCEIEHKTRDLIDRQQAHGFWFDTSGARDLHRFLRQRESDLAVPVQNLFPPKLEALGTYKRRRTKDGTDYASFTRHTQTYPHIEENLLDGTYTCFDYFPFNLASPAQRLERLLEVGYIPTKFTKKGNPSVDEESLLAFAEVSGRLEAKALAEWLVHNGRANMVETWLKNVDPKDSRIHGKVHTCAATTRRMTHSGPNTANIPSPHKAQYGKECRSLWSVEPGRGLSLVGADAASLETVGLCHYLKSKTATEILTRDKPNDVHSANSRSLTAALGRSVDREWGAKTAWYAWLYGAYPKKLGQIVGGTPADGSKVIDTFFRNVPGLRGLKQEVEDEWNGNSGLLLCIDGGYVRSPSSNSALNYKIQSLGAVVMKLAAIYLVGMAITAGVDYATVGTIHDEWQMETQKADSDRLGQLAVESIKRAAENLNFTLPLGGDYKVGKSWDETH